MCVFFLHKSSRARACVPDEQAKTAMSCSTSVPSLLDMLQWGVVAIDYEVLCKGEENNPWSAFWLKSDACLSPKAVNSVCDSAEKWLRTKFGSDAAADSRTHGPLVLVGDAHVAVGATRAARRDRHTLRGGNGSSMEEAMSFSLKQVVARMLFHDMLGGLERCSGVSTERGYVEFVEHDRASLATHLARAHDAWSRTGTLLKACMAAAPALRAVLVAANADGRVNAAVDTVCALMSLASATKDKHAIASWMGVTGLWVGIAAGVDNPRVPNQGAGPCKLPWLTTAVCGWTLCRPSFAGEGDGACFGGPDKAGPMRDHLLKYVGACGHRWASCPPGATWETRGQWALDKALGAKRCKWCAVPYLRQLPDTVGPEALTRMWRCVMHTWRADVDPAIWAKWFPVEATKALARRVEEAPCSMLFACLAAAAESL